LRPAATFRKARVPSSLPIVFTPINRWGTPADVRRTVTTLAARELPFTTGVAIQVDGGMHIHQY
jgi:3-oxoacyl-[acyl-carrier protein] reductase